MPYIRNRQRKVLKRRCTSSAPQILVSTPGPPSAKSKQWTKNQMKKAIAIEAGKSGKSWVNCAFADHGISSNHT